MELYGTATAAASGTVDLAELAPYPAEAELFDVYGVSNITDATEGVVTAFTQASNRLTFAPVGTWTGDLVELWQPGFSATDVNNYINSAIDIIAEEVLKEWSNTTMAYEGDVGETVLPAGAKVIFGVQYLTSGPSVGYGKSNITTYRNLTTTSTWFSQGFVAPSTTLYRGVGVFIGRTGTITGTVLRCRLYSNSSGVPGSAVTGASATYAADALTTTEGQYIFFDFGAPVALTDGTTYHVVLDISTAGTADASNYIRWGEDGSGEYGDGALSTSTNGGSTWAAVAASDMAFQVVPYSDTWEDLFGHEWDVVNTSPTAHRIRVVRDGGQWLSMSGLSHYPSIAEGTPLRILGLRRIDRPTSDTAELEISRSYLEAKALQLLLRDFDIEQFKETIAYLGQVADTELMKHPARTHLPPNSRILTIQGAG